MSETTQVVTLTDFLLARLAEDEAALAKWSVVTRQELRTLADVEAKRRIVGMYDETNTRAQPLDGVMYALASVYADHPDYRDEWRP